MARNSPFASEKLRPFRTSTGPFRDANVLLTLGSSTAGTFAASRACDDTTDRCADLIAWTSSAPGPTSLSSEFCRGSYRKPAARPAGPKLKRVPIAVREPSLQLEGRACEQRR